MTNLKIGTLVKITDGSQAIRVDKYEQVSTIGLCKDTFEVIAFNDSHLTHACGGTFHNVFIQNTTNNNIYLHSICCIQPIEIRYISHQEAERVLSETFNKSCKIV